MLKVTLATCLILRRTSQLDPPNVRPFLENLFKTPFYEGLYQLRRVIIAIGAIKG